MTRDEFYNLKEGDLLTNKDLVNGVKVGYNYRVIHIDRISPVMDVTVKELKMGGIYHITADNVESCIGLRKYAEQEPSALENK